MSHILAFTGVLFGVFLIPAVALVVVERRRRRGRDAVAPGGRPDGPLFVVRYRRWQVGVVRAAAPLLFLLGGMLLLGAGSPSGREQAGMIVVFAVGAFLFGVALLAIAHGVARWRIEVHVDRLEVCSGFRAPRRVPIADIGWLAGYDRLRYGAIQGGPVDGPHTFSAGRLTLGYADLVAFLRAHRPGLAIPSSARPL